jgi:ABC-type multidrug transport system fused ATPase/permease subunit
VTAPKSGDRSYKRSWKNLLINKRYQLRFTLFMVGLTSLLMAGLGIWVMWVANETTEVSMASVRGEACPKAPVIGDGAPSGSDEDGATKPDTVTDGKPAPDAEPRRINVQIDESSMTLTPPPAQQPAAAPPHFATPHDLADQVSDHWKCELAQTAQIDLLERGRLQNFWAMVATGLLLVLGLAAYGLKMTHRVAGPLFKVRLYLSKMRQGRFDTVYNLRKGDQLVEFYDHFKKAHGGVVTMQRTDIDQLSQLIAAAEAAGAGQHPAVAELRELIARKEKSIE